MDGWGFLASKALSAGAIVTSASSILAGATVPGVEQPEKPMAAAARIPVAQILKKLL